MQVEDAGKSECPTVLQASFGWQTMVKIAKAESISHISRSELLQLMKGNGKGKAKWPSAFEVMQARRYVEQWGEHLLDFRRVEFPEKAVRKVFSKS